MPSVIPGIPYIDPNVDHVAMDRLQEMSTSSLKRLKKTLVVRDGDSPLAVVVPFKTFLRIQREIDRLSELVEDYQDRADPLYFGGFPGFDAPGLEGIADEFDDTGAGNIGETGTQPIDGKPE